MNLYLRLIWLLLTYRFKPKMAFTDTLDRPMTSQQPTCAQVACPSNPRSLLALDRQPKAA